VGLRMGIGGDFKISRAIQRLNRILNKSRLTTKFVSLFYGEFDLNGEFIYVNAGHPGPLHLHADRHAFSELESTGLVLGPSPDAVYGRRATKMEPGDVMVLYTDGILEAHDRKLWELRHRSAREICERLLEAVQEWGKAAAAEDDRTVVVVKRELPGERSAAGSATLQPR
jgi:sigma-B regulation protein RsbU (phosphoserine phosphatase)